MSRLAAGIWVGAYLARLQAEGIDPDEKFTGNRHDPAPLTADERVAVADPDIRQLTEADAATLRQIWQETRGAAPPKTFTARLMRLALAWECGYREESACCLAPQLAMR
mgnify:CR=1 FL=1